MAAHKQSSPLLILCYHGISQAEEHKWNPELYIPPQLFRQRLQAIDALGYEIRALGSALEDLHNGTLRRPTVVLTFDDGWYDFYSQAWPVLKEFSAPATVYQTTFYSNYNRPVFDVTCAYLFWRGLGRTLKDRFLTGVDEPVTISSAQIGRQLCEALKDRVQQLGYGAEEKDHVLWRLAGSLLISYDAILQKRLLHLMNSSEIREVSRAGIDIQLHTHSHYMPQEKQNFLREIERNRFFIEIATGTPTTHFCYPNGWYRPEVGQWLEDAGVKSATTCDPGAVRRNGSSMYLPRLTDSCYVSHIRFESWLAGVGLLGASAKRRFSLATGHGRKAGGASPAAPIALPHTTLEPLVESDAFSSARAAGSGR